MLAEFRRRRDAVVAGLNALPGVSCVMPRGAFYAFPNISGSGLGAKELADRLLDEVGVAVLAGTAFGSFGEGYLRLSYANSLENIEAALAAMGGLLAEPARVNASRVIVTRRLAAPALELLRDAGEVWLSPHDRPLRAEELREASAAASAIVSVLDDRIDAALLDAAGPSLQVVANVAVGYDNIDVLACEQHGVQVTNTPGVLTEATADIALALILMATRRLGEAERLVRSGEAWSWQPFFHLGTGIQGRMLGIVGLGQIGQATARRGRACGMEIVYSSPRRASAALEAELGARYLPLAELLATADVVSLHCPLREDTRNLIDAEALATMKRSAFLVNTTRGAVVDEAALVEALRDGVIAGAGLDVYAREPSITPGRLELENVVLLPHLGSATHETRTEMAMLAARNVAAVLRGAPPLTPVVAVAASR